MTDDLLTSRVIRKFQNFAPLAETEKRALLDAVSPTRMYGPHEDLAREGELTGNANIVLSGFVCRQKILPDGRRQIIGFLLPGDVCDVRISLLRRMDHTVSTISSAKVAALTRDAAMELIARCPGLARALMWSAMVEESVTREWLVNVGQRTALERLAHLLCEVYTRLRAVGLADMQRCELPLTQADLGDTLALSTVHVNRTLRELRHAELISIRGKCLRIHDLQGLQTIGMFDPNYLHLDGEQNGSAVCRKDIAQTAW